MLCTKHETPQGKNVGSAAGACGGRIFQPPMQAHHYVDSTRYARGTAGPFEVAVRGPSALTGMARLKTTSLNFCQQLTCWHEKTSGARCEARAAPSAFRIRTLVVCAANLVGVLLVGAANVDGEALDLDVHVLGVRPSRCPVCIETTDPGCKTVRRKRSTKCSELRGCRPMRPVNREFILTLRTSGRSENIKFPLPVLVCWPRSWYYSHHLFGSGRKMLQNMLMFPSIGMM